MFSLKNLNFRYIKFGGPALSQLVVYFISWSFRNIENYKSACVCVCVCVCVFVCVIVCVQAGVCICMYKCDKWKQCYMQNTISRIYLRKVTKLWKFINCKVKKLPLIYMTHILTGFIFFQFVSSSIKMLYTLKQSWKRIFMGILI